MGNQKSPKKIILLSIGAIIVLAVAIFAIKIIGDKAFEASHSAFLDIEYQPLDATVLLDGEKITISSDLIRITPGDHSIAIIHNGFFPEGVEFSIKDGETYTYNADLSPSTEEASKTSDSF